MIGGCMTAVVLSACLGCDSREDEARRREAEAAARVYRAAGARASDNGDRDFESADAKQLLTTLEAQGHARREVQRLETYLASTEAETRSKAVIDEQKRLLDRAKKDLGRVEGLVPPRRKVVEANRDKLVRLKKETEAAIAHPTADAELSAEVLRDRLSGVEASLAQSNAALVGKTVNKGAPAR
jgi:hypothetical protein